MKESLRYSSTTVLLFLLIMSMLFAAQIPVTGAAFDVTIDARDYTKGGLNVEIILDGGNSGFTTPHVFTGLVGTHTFTVPDEDSFLTPFSFWNTISGARAKWTGTTLTVTAGGSYVAEYSPGSPHDVTVQAWEFTRGSAESVPITMDGSATGFNTPHVFENLVGTHDFTVPSSDSYGVPFGNWDVGGTSTTITVGNAGGTFTARYYYSQYNITIFSWDSVHDMISGSVTMDSDPKSYVTPYTFTGLVGRHSFTVPSIDSYGNPFVKWHTGETNRTLSVTSGGNFTAWYFAQVATPTFSPAPGTYSSTQNVQLSCGTADSLIRFTTDGSEPTTSSTIYSNPLVISATTTIKAKAFKMGMAESDTAQATYTINANTMWDLSLSVVGSGSLDPSAGVHSYDDGSEVSVQATPSTNWVFYHWVLDGTVTVATNPVSITMGKDRNVVAVFTRAPPIIDSCDVDGASKNSFSPTDKVYLSGVGYGQAATVDVYIVSDVAWTDGMTLPSRVSGTVATLVSDSSGKVKPSIVWNSPLVEGKYDVCIDVNRNGIYEKNTDALDNNQVQVTAGFVVPEFPSSLVLLSVLVLSTAMVGFLRKRNGVHLATV